MACTIKNRDGRADSSVTPTGTESLHLYGPPHSGNPNAKGVYIRQVAGASGIWRHLEDLQTPGVASPTTFTYAGY